MNVNSNEALAYAQSSQGVRFIRCVFIDRFEEFQKSTRSAPIREYFYKVPPEIHVEVGDVVLVQVLDKHFGIGKVLEVFDDPPASDEYNYDKTLKWAFAKVDVETSDRLKQIDRNAFKAISRASVRARMNEISKSLGFDVAQAVGPALTFQPPSTSEPDEAQVIDDTDLGPSQADEDFVRVAEEDQPKKRRVNLSDSALMGAPYEFDQ